MKNTIKNFASDVYPTIYSKNTLPFTTNYNKILFNFKLHSKRKIIKISMFCLLAILLFSACKKEIDSLPSAGKTNLSDSTLKSGTVTYYIDPNGSDAAKGDITHPWKTLYYASGCVTTIGSIIHVNAGSYLNNTECVISPGVSIEGAGKYFTTIKTNYVNASTGHGFITMNSAKGYVGTGQHISGITFDGNNVATKCICTQYRSNISINNCNFIRFAESAIRFNGITSLETPKEPQSNTGWSYNNTVYNCRITNVGGYNNWGIGIFGQDNCQIYNDTIINTKTAGTGGDCVYSSTNIRLKVHDNWFERANYVYPYWNFCVELRWHFGEFEFYNNRCKGSVDVCLVYKNSHAFGAKIHDNIVGWDVPVVTNNMGFTFEADIHAVTFKNNTVKNCNTGLSHASNGLYNVSVDSFAIVQNLFQNIGEPNTLYQGFGIKLVGGTSGSWSKTYHNIMIYNNDIIGNGYATNAVILGDKGTFDDIKIKNNIISFWDAGSTHGYAPICVSRASGQQFTVNSLIVDHNLIYSTGNSNNIKYTNITPTSSSQTNTLKLDPKFTNRETLNFKLQSTSPAINAGINVGLPYKGSAPDIGAFEY